MNQQITDGRGATVRLTPEQALARYWGYTEFRPLQREAVAAVLAQRDALVILPTGGGKSLCYQLPAACGIGLVLVISPLIALMDDQVAAARENGLAAGALHSQTTAEKRRRTWAELQSGRLSLLYVSPERLVAGDLLELVSGRVGLFAIDEAHCVSHWGHEFRPEYRQLGALFAGSPAVPRLALTATATPAVQADIREQLGLRQPACLIGHPDRPNLTYRAFPRHDQSGQVLEVIRRHRGEGGIVYAQTRREVERLAKTLAQKGVACAPYHAGLDAAVRAKVQDDFVNERLDVVVATIAFGMGIDRSNVRYVVHANTPRSIEHYQQESGRAGRDGAPAECVLLFSVADLVMHRVLANRDETLTGERKRVLERQLHDIGRYAGAPVCRHRLLTEHFGQPYPPVNDAFAQRQASSGPASPGRDAPTPAPADDSETNGCCACDVCLEETRALPADEALLTAQKIISAAYRTGNRFGAGYVAKVLRGHADPRMTANGHDSLRVFGLLRDHAEPTVRAWIDQLVVQGHLAVTDGEYPLLQTTPAGLALCKGQGTVRLGHPAPALPKGRRRGGRISVAGGSAGVGEDAAGAGDAAGSPLYEKLRRLRLLLAKKQGVPPYVVFHDSTLLSMAALRPRDLAALGQLKGLGESKLARYGRAFLAVIAGEDPEGVVAGGEAE